jgi:carboxylesterase
MRLVGDYLHRRGYTVSAPLLPGHGTTIEDMNRRTWREWADHVEATYDVLRSQCDRVVVGGLSMGTLLSLSLAAAHPTISSLALYAPAARVNNRLIHLAPLLKPFVPVWRKSRESDLGDPQAQSMLWHYDGYPVAAAHELLKLIVHVRRLLPQVTSPALIFHAARDKHIREGDSRYAFDRLGSKDKELVVLRASGHALTVDQEWEAVARRTYAFFEERLT